MPSMNTPRPIQPDRLNEYITASILPALGAGSRSFSLAPVSGGSRNLIWFLTVEGGGRFVLKAVSKRFRIKNIIWAHAHLERRAIPVPRLFFADRAWKTAETMGYYFACEELVEGRPLEELGEGRSLHIDRAAAVFACMHAVRSFRWGKLKSFQVLGFRDYFLRKMSERARALASSGCLSGGGSADSLVAWFERKKSVIRPFARFSLCHGDVNMKNILVCPDTTIRLIDTEAFKFLPFQMEFFRLAYALCGFDDALHRRFRDAYAAAAPKKNRRALERCGPLYQSYVLLEIAWHFNKKLKQATLPESARSAFSGSRGSALEQLAAIMSKNP
jgi:aminoglycoside phosphotransferase (APT) family kinase protein